MIRRELTHSVRIEANKYVHKSKEYLFLFKFPHARLNVIISHNPIPRMKLIIAGATGFVGRNLLKEALACSDITSIVTLGRRPVVSEYAERAKVTNIVLDDLEHYPASVMEKIADADACIW